MEEIQQIKQLIEDLSNKVDNLDSSLSMILQRSLTEQSVELNDPIDEARLFTLFAYAIDSTIYAYLKSMGVNTESHPIMKELERIKSYMNKINKKEQKDEEIKRKHIVDKDAAVRFIQASLSDIPKETIENQKPKADMKRNHPQNGSIKKKNKKSKKKQKQSS